MLQFDWLNEYCTPYIRPILQYCKIIGTYVYLESREKSNEPIVETLAQLVTKPQSSNGCIECFNLIGWINIVPYIFVLSFRYSPVISTFLYVEIHERNRMNLYLELYLNWLHNHSHLMGALNAAIWLAESILYPIYSSYPSKFPGY